MHIDPVQARHLKRFANLLAMSQVGLSVHKPLAVVQTVDRKLKNSEQFWSFTQVTQPAKAAQSAPEPTQSVSSPTLAPPVQAPVLERNSSDAAVDQILTQKPAYAAQLSSPQAKPAQAPVALHVIRASEFFRKLPWLGHSLAQIADVPQRLMSVQSIARDTLAASFFRQLPWLSSKVQKLSIGSGQDHPEAAMLLSQQLGRISPAGDWKQVAAQSAHNFFSKIPWARAKRAASASQEPELI